MKTTITFKLASVLLAMLFLTNDLLASYVSITVAQKEEIVLPSKTTGNAPVRSDDANATTRTRTQEQSGLTRDVKTSTSSFKAKTFVDSEDGICYLGENENDPLRSPEDDVFSFDVDKVDLEHNQTVLKFTIKRSEDSNQEIYVQINGTSNKVELPEDLSAKVLVEVPADLLKHKRQQLVFSTSPYLRGSIEVSEVKLQNVEGVNVHTNAVMELLSSKEASQFDFTVVDQEGQAEKGFVLKGFQAPSIPLGINNLNQHAQIFSHRSAGSQQQAIKKVKIAIDKSKLLGNEMLNEAKVFYFNHDEKAWKPVAPSKIYPDVPAIEASVPGNTDYFAGVIKSPDMPEAAAHVPTALSGIQAANPSEGINIMSPPSVSNTGEATINYPIDIPEGTKGLTPPLSLNYNSDRGTGKIGVGWDINVSEISIDSRWGVPEFPTNVQEEVYTFDGQSLSEQDNFKGNKTKINPNTGEIIENLRRPGPLHFFERTRNSYREIIRYGNNPNNYYWVVKHGNGTTYFYGCTDLSTLDEGSIQRRADNNIVRWGLKKVEDIWGNNILYTYDKSSNTNAQKPLLVNGKRFLIDKIEYTGHNGAAGLYELDFQYSASERADATVSHRRGLKEIDDLSLSSIDVKFNSQPTPVVVKTIEFVYNTPSVSSQFKTLLLSLNDRRNGTLFYSHTFTYEDGTMGYDSPVEFTVDDVQDDVWRNWDASIASVVAHPFSKSLQPSPLGLQRSTSWNAGGAIGFGIALGPRVKQDKNYTIAGRAGFGESNSRFMVDMNDYNGDGLLDVLYSRTDKFYIKPGLVSGNGTYALGAPLQYRVKDLLGDNTDLFKSSKSIYQDYGYDVTLGLLGERGPVFNHGMNWHIEKSYSDYYTTDYNNDGLLDIVYKKSGGGSGIAFGKMTQSGITFSLSSEETPNPVVQKESLDISLDDYLDDLESVEVVKVWEAPFDGEVSISGNAAFSSSLQGEVQVGVQRNSSVILNFATLQSGNSFNVNTSTSVVKGDVLLFRVRSGDEGYFDLITWNPQVSYTSTTSSRTIDENAVNYGSSNYDQGFYLKGQEGVSFSGDKGIKVEWPQLSINGLSDDITVMAYLGVEDKQNNTEITYIYQKDVASNSSLTVSPTDLKELGQANAPSFMSGVDYPVSTSNSDLECSISFVIHTNSNVDIQSIDWRPKVSIYSEHCNQGQSGFNENPDAIVYPVVDVKHFGKIIQLEPDFVNSAFSSSPNDFYYFIPSFHSSANYTALFNTSGPINYGEHKAILSVKKDNMVLSRLGVKVTSSGSTLWTVNQDGTFANQITNDGEREAWLGFEGSLIEEDNVYLVYSTNDLTFAEFLRDYLRETHFFSSSGGQASLIGSQQKTSIIVDDKADLYLPNRHWGQFVWKSAKTPISPIPVASLYIKGRSIASNPINDFSDASELPDESHFSNQDLSDLSPEDWEFIPLNPIRGEVSLKSRDFITDELNPSIASDMDRYVFFGGHVGVYRNSAIVPGIWGEPEGSPAAQNNLTVGDPLFTASGIQAINTSKSLATSNGISFTFSGGSGLSYTNSQTLNALSPNFVQRQESGLQDFNGDGYPDVWRVDGGNSLLIDVTNPLGGLTLDRSITVSSTESLSENYTNNNTSVVAGTYVNETHPKAGINVSGSVGAGTTKSNSFWMDINGDGLPDRIVEDGQQSDLYINQGQSVAQVTYANKRVENQNNTYSLGASFTQLPNLASKLNWSWSAGLGLNWTGSEKNGMYVDINGDGLVDFIKELGSSYELYLNRGTELTVAANTSPDNLDVLDDLDQSKNLATTANASGTIGIWLGPSDPVGATHFKLSINAFGSFGLSLSELKNSFRDFNGDGVVDFVVSDAEGDLQIYYANHAKANLLREVFNPLGGGFEISYESEGHKVGPKGITIRTHETHDGDQILWDMPNQKWVMRTVVVKDGHDVQDASNADIDGEDDILYTFNYDGGIYSRRERTFLGFSRVERRMPHAESLPVSLEDTMVYLTYVDEYHLPNSNDADYRRRSEYLMNVKFASLKLHNRFFLLQADPAVYHTSVKLLNDKKYDFEFRKIETSTSDKNKVIIESTAGNGDITWSTVSSNQDWNDLSETACLFPAVVSTETFDIPQRTAPHNFYAQKYTMEYDEFLNTTEVNNEGESSIGTKDSTKVGEIVKQYYEVVTAEHPISDFLNPPVGGDIVLYTTDPTTGEKCFIVNGPNGFSPDTVCIPVYLETPNPCFNYPPIDPEVGYTVTTVHKKLVTHTTHVWDVWYNTTYTGASMARMEYFSPISASNRTNVLKEHKVFLGSTANVATRFTEAVLTGDGKGTQRIINYLDPANTTAGYLKAETDFTYKSTGRGNIETITGPVNSMGQRMVNTFVYEASMEKYITRVTNSYGESTCMKFNYATGNLLKTEDPNGHAIQYEYDDFHRLESVWGPRELEVSDEAALITFEYYPNGAHEIAGVANNSRTRVPVAFTYHKLEDVGTTAPSPQTQVVNCNSLTDVSGRPQVLKSQLLQTVNFQDGLGRSIQVKKDVSNLGTKQRIVSGISAYDKLGRVTQQTRSELETLTAFHAGELNNNVVQEVLVTTTYDYDSRPKTQTKVVDVSNNLQIDYTYHWNDVLGSNKFYARTNGVTDNFEYYNSRGQKIASVQSNSGGSLIKTEFTYNAINELQNSIDPLGHPTSYQYDRFGRMIEEDHPDRGLSVCQYDLAGNFIRFETPGTGSQGIDMTYDFNRLKTKTMPGSLNNGNNGTSNVNDVTFNYGTLNDGKNGAGRVVQVVQGNGFKIENYKYDELGNQVYEEKSINIPQIGYKNYVTLHNYDTWGRIKKITYPDQEQVTYTYNSTGDLYAIEKELVGIGSSPTSIINSIQYDGFNNIKNITYGNGVYTSFEYDAKSRVFNEVDLYDGVLSDQLLNKTYTYDNKGNVASVVNNITPDEPYKFAYEMHYSYDDYNRLSGVSNGYLWDMETPTSQLKVHKYGLAMSYNAAGGIVTKNQTDYDETSASLTPYATDYDLSYDYSTAKPHQLKYVTDNASGDVREYEYNLSGSIERVSDPGTAAELEKFVWDEGQMLRGVRNANGIHHYVYDHTGNRILKSSVLHTSLSQGSGSSGSSYVLDPYVVYVNPYYVATHFRKEDEQGLKEVSKHYYMGGTRVATSVKLELDNFEGYETQSGVLLDLDDLLTNYFDLVQEEDYTLEGLNTPQLISDYEIDNEDYFQYAESCEEAPDPDLCRCMLSQYWAWVSTSESGEPLCADKEIMYWYHPDYLGSNEYITDISGRAHQFFWNSPFGENLHTYTSYNSSFGSIYRFNGKEQDDETGNYYYGARYYNPKISMWLSVDPMSAAAPGWTPYRFCFNNPVNIIDPTGLFEDDIYLNAEGEVTRVEENDKPNRFFDENGNEIHFHDDGEGGLDNHMLHAKFIIGEKLYHTVSVVDYVGALEEAGIEDDRGVISTATKSHGGADFAEGYLAENYDVPRFNENDSRRANYNSQAGYFKFEGSNRVYNLYDAGNHMWGTWMRLNGWSLSDALSGADANEFWGDNQADQDAIRNGWNYGTYNPY